MSGDGLPLGRARWSRRLINNAAAREQLSLGCLDPPETLAHLHCWAVQLTRKATTDEVIEAFRSSSRIALIRITDGLTAINAVKELMADIGRPRDNLHEVALCEDLVTVEGDEAFYAYMVDNQAIVTSSLAS